MRERTTAMMSCSSIISFCKVRGSVVGDRGAYDEECPRQFVASFMQLDEEDGDDNTNDERGENGDGTDEMKGQRGVEGGLDRGSFAHGEDRIGESV